MNSIDPSHGGRANNAKGICDHCHGILKHESWCVTLDPQVSYARQIVNEASKLTFADSLILHSLGVTWADAQV